MDKVDIKDRIKEAMELREINQAELSKRANIDKGQLSSYIAGKYKPRQNNIESLSIALNVSEAWLMGYDVPMGRNEFKDAPKNNHLSFDNVEDFKNAYRISNFRKNTFEYKILDNMEKLNNDGKKSLFDYSNILLGNPNFTKDTSDHLTVRAAHNDFSNEEEQQKLMKEDLDEL